MNLDKLEIDPAWIARKLDLIQQHHADWQLYFAAEDESWHSLQQKHHRQQKEWRDASVNVVNWKPLIQQQLREIQHWRRTMAHYRQALQTRQDEKSHHLEAEKRALAGYLAV